MIQYTEDTPLITIVITLSETPGHLGECLESVVNQTYSNLEIVLAGSPPDNVTRELCDSWMAKDSRIRSVYTPAEASDASPGVAQQATGEGFGTSPASPQRASRRLARKAGFEHSTGSLVTFVSDDDLIDANLIWRLHELYANNDVSLALCGLQTFRSQAALGTQELEAASKVLRTRKESLAYLIESFLKPTFEDRRGVEALLIEREIVSQTDWGFGDYLYDDGLFEALQWFSLATQGIALSESQLYHRRIGPQAADGSACQNNNPDGEVPDYYQYLLDRFELVMGFLEDSELEMALLRSFAQANSQYGLANRPADDGAVPGISGYTRNLEQLLSQYERQLVARDSQIDELQFKLDDIFESRIWPWVLRVWKLLSGPTRLFRRGLGRLRQVWLKAMRYEDAWVIIDRRDEATDNGILFYRYLASRHPEINAIFALSDSSPDFQRLKGEGVRLVAFESDQHRMIMRHAAVEAAAFMDYSPYGFTAKERDKPLIRAFISHGMEGSDLSEHYRLMNTDLIASTNQLSYDFYMSGNSAFDVRDKPFRVIGMPRYDLLRELRQAGLDAERDTIVICPTWRQYLMPEPLRLGETDYWDHWGRVLNSPELAELAGRFKFVFIPHPMLRDKMRGMSFPESIDIRTYSDIGGTERLYELAARTELFVTDYSSTAFDFAFLGSKVAYFSFDEDTFYSKSQYIYRNWFDINTDGFGPCFPTAEELLAYLAAGEYQLYGERVERIWQLIPEDACEALVMEIRKLLEERG